jgi:hypothetical protein
MGLAAIIGVSYPCVGLSQTPSPTAAERDGQHDFDFNMGDGEATVFGDEFISGAGVMVTCCDLSSAAQGASPNVTLPSAPVHL